MIVGFFSGDKGWLDTQWTGLSPDGIRLLFILLGFLFLGIAVWPWIYFSLFAPRPSFRMIALEVPNRKARVVVENIGAAARVSFNARAAVVMAPDLLDDTKVFSYRPPLESTDSTFIQMSKADRENIVLAETGFGHHSWGDVYSLDVLQATQEGPRVAYGIAWDQNSSPILPNVLIEISLAADPEPRGGERKRAFSITGQTNGDLLIEMEAPYTEHGIRWLRYMLWR